MSINDIEPVEVPEVDTTFTKVIKEKYITQLLNCLNIFEALIVSDPKYSVDTAQINKYITYINQNLVVDKPLQQCHVNKLKRISKHITVYKIRNDNRTDKTEIGKRRADDLADLFEGFAMKANEDELDTLAAAMKRTKVVHDEDECPAQEGGKKKRSSKSKSKVLKAGGAKKETKKKYTKTTQKIVFKKRERSIYLGVRGGKYVKVKGEFVPIK